MKFYFYFGSFSIVRSQSEGTPCETDGDCPNRACAEIYEDGSLAEKACVETYLCGQTGKYASHVQDVWTYAIECVDGTNNPGVG